MEYCFNEDKMFGGHWIIFLDFLLPSPLSSASDTSFPLHLKAPSPWVYHGKAKEGFACLLLALLQGPSQLLAFCDSHLALCQPRPHCRFRTLKYSTVLGMDAGILTQDGEEPCPSVRSGWKELGQTPVCIPLALLPWTEHALSKQVPVGADP